jgi:hypothetical protein
MARDLVEPLFEKSLWDNYQCSLGHVLVVSLWIRDSLWLFAGFSVHDTGQSDNSLFKAHLVAEYAALGKMFARLTFP